MATLFELQVEMEDGTTTDVVADQRDIARWEIQDFGCPLNDIGTRMHLAYRWLGWSALSRRGLTELSWPDFDRLCLEVRDLPEPADAADEAEPSEALDPGQPAPSASTSSRSRGGRTNR